MGILNKLFWWNKKENNELVEVNKNDDYDNVKEPKNIEEILGGFEDNYFTINNDEEFNMYIKGIEEERFGPFSILSNINPESGLLEKKEIILEILRHCGMDLRYVNDEFKEDVEVIEMAFKNNPNSIQFAKNVTLSLVMKICDDVQKFIIVTSYFPKMIDKLQEDNMNRELLLGMLKQKPSLIHNLTKYQSDMEFFNVAIEASPMYIMYAPENISDDMIISELKKYYKLLLENMRVYANKNDNVLNVWNEYNSKLNFFLEMINRIKENNPERFKNEDFILQLFYINPILIRAADVRDLHDPFLREMYETYEGDTPVDVYNKFSSKR